MSSAHPHVPNLVRGLLVAAALGLLGLGVYQRLYPHRPSPDDVLDLVKAGQPLRALDGLDVLLRDASRALEGKREPEALDAYRRARDLAAAARAELLAERMKKADDAGKTPDIRPPRGPATSFAEREALACLVLAGVALDPLYAARAGAGEGDAPPPEETTRPIRADIERGLAADPSEKRLYRLLGLLEMLEGRNVAAAAAFERAVELDRDFAPAYNNLGRVYLRMMQPDKAKDAFEKALLAAGADATLRADAQFNLGVYYAAVALAGAQTPAEARTRAREKARRHLSEFLETPGSAAAPDAERAKDYLRQLDAAPAAEAGVPAP